MNRMNAKTVWAICLALGLASGAAVIGAPYGTAAGLAIAAALLLGAVIAAWQITRLQAARIEAVMAEQQQAYEARLQVVANQGITGLEDFCTRAVPNWARQIETARAETEESITALAQRFSGISERLSGAVAASQQTSSDIGGQGAIDVIETSERELTALIDTLRTAQHARDVVFGEIRGLSRYTVELQKMAADVAAIAAQAGALAHKLKSSARSVGALALGDLCDEIEQAGKAGQVNALTALLLRFEAEMAGVDEYLGSL